MACELPQHCVLGIQTAVKHFDIVYLWCYEPVRNAPSGVLLRDAAELLHNDTRKRLASQRVSICHVADVVRMRAAARHSGWVIDADSIWLRSPPIVDYVFGTLYEKRSGGVAPRSAAWAAQKAAFAKASWDGGDRLNTPFAFHADSPFAAAVERLVSSFVAEQLAGPKWAAPPTKTQWQALMQGTCEVRRGQPLPAEAHAPAAFVRSGALHAVARARAVALVPHHWHRPRGKDGEARLRRSGAGEVGRDCLRRGVVGGDDAALPERRARRADRGVAPVVRRHRLEGGSGRGESGRVAGGHYRSDPFQGGEYIAIVNIINVGADIIARI